MSEKEVSPEARKSALESDYAALYAVAGLTDALADALKGALAETQQKATKRINELQSRRPELSKQAKTSVEDLRTFVITLPDQFKHLPDTTKARIAELQRQANDLLAQATSAYGDYAVRGKQAVDEARRSTRERSNPNGTPVTPRSAATDIGEPAAERPAPRRTMPRSPAPKRPAEHETTLTPHPLARAPRVQERWGVSSPPPGLT